MRWDERSLAFFSRLRYSVRHREVNMKKILLFCGVLGLFAASCFATFTHSSKKDPEIDLPECREMARRITPIRVYLACQNGLYEYCSVVRVAVESCMRSKGWAVQNPS